MHNGFRIGRAFDRATSSFLQMLDGCLGDPRLYEVMSEQLGLRFNRLGEPRHESIGNPIVELLALASDHRGIGCILNQRMLEDVSRIRRFTADRDQIASDCVVERAPQRGARGNSREQTIGEFATYGSTNLHNLLAWAKLIKARG